MSDTNLQVLHIPFKSDLNGRSWIHRDDEVISAIPNITKEELIDFYDSIDYSLNQDAQPKFEKTINEKNEEGYGSFSDCIFLVFKCFLGDGYDPTSRGRGSGVTPAGETNQPSNIKACKKVLDSESERREDILFQLVVSRGGGYALFVKCTIMPEEEEEEESIKA
ncbi:predicted protein [Chaetoceros tenuissimus]|uniref:Uncharacterized protein n=1 Tax=Chaetoceros tenuissimus TaxID=426638 RepID=A0AAD3D0E8_9STRA|nr:predicted protein [Chaetoceros tenuissimus]